MRPQITSPTALVAVAVLAAVSAGARVSRDASGPTSYSNSWSSWAKVLASILLLLIPSTHAKRDEHVVLYAWPTALSHGFVAATIAKRLAHDYSKVSLLVGSCDYSMLVPRAGHDVNVVAFDVTLPRTVAMLGMEWNPKMTIDNRAVTEMVRKISAWNDPIKSLPPIAMAAMENTKCLLENDKVKAVLESATVLVADQAWLVFAFLLKQYAGIKTVVSYTPIGVIPGLIPLGNVESAYDPAFGSQSNGVDMTLLTAAKNVFLKFVTEVYVLPTLYTPFCDYGVQAGILTRENVKTNGCVKEIMRGVVDRLGITMVLSDPALELPMPMLPTYEFVGHVLSSPAAPLQGEIAEWVKGNQGGFVLVSLGTLGSLQHGALDALTDELGKLAPIRVVWKMQDKPKPRVPIPDNVKIVKWMPQNDLLGHPKVRAFMTHGGRNSLEESAYHGVPIVGVPLFGDQHDNLVRAVKRGYCIIVDQSSIAPNQPALSNAFSLALSDEYAENANRVKNNIRAHKTPPLEKVAEWVEFGVSTGGAEHRIPVWIKDQKWTYWEMASPHILLWSVVAAIFIVALQILLRCASGVRTLLVRPPPPKRGKSHDA
jgi:hypothetical protein